VELLVPDTMLELASSKLGLLDFFLLVRYVFIPLD